MVNAVELTRRLTALQQQVLEVEAALLEADANEPALADLVAHVRRVWRGEAVRWWVSRHMLLPDYASPRDAALASPKGRQKVAQILGGAEFGTAL